MNAEQVEKILKSHLSWLNNEGGYPADFQDADLKYFDFTKAILEGANFRNANLKYAWLEGADLENAVFEGANLEDTVLEDATLEGANLIKANLKKANLKNANLEGACLADANLEGADLRGANLQGSCLEKAYLKNANFQGANLEGVDWRGAGGANPVEDEKKRNALINKFMSLYIGDDDNLDEYPIDVLETLVAELAQLDLNVETGMDAIQKVYDRVVYSSR